MKAAYGSFLEGLLVIYMDDLVADAAGERYNVNWTRISPMVMSVHDDIDETYITREVIFILAVRLMAMKMLLKPFIWLVRLAFHRLSIMLERLYFQELAI